MTTATTRSKSRRILLQACPHCQGDMLHDLQDDEFVCMQCSRRFSAERLAQQQQPQVPALAA